MQDTDFQKLQEGHSALNAKYADLSGRVEQIEIKLDGAARKLEENTQTTNEIHENTKDIVEAVKVGIKVYKFMDWMRLAVKNWAWLPAGAMWWVGYAKGWWKDVPWFWK